MTVFTINRITDMEMLSRGKRERGAIIIHVAFALLALLAFSAFVVDMGMMWVSRGQAQNAADAGALAGAVALMRDGHEHRAVGVSVDEQQRHLRCGEL